MQWKKRSPLVDYSPIKGELESCDVFKMDTNFFMLKLNSDHNLQDLDNSVKMKMLVLYIGTEIDESWNSSVLLTKVRSKLLKAWMLNFEVNSNYVMKAAYCDLANSCLVKENIVCRNSGALLHIVNYKKRKKLPSR